ncbi:hypothetical protein KNT87_gp206 [Erwinia phage Cronus]|uniref:Uncharacterized protein n=1 Tax=Erwinia phage Cronus TaxID=2163633 RepID=A0A2S1GLZ4_9CAUD|nr:hypothetical protein KNT87_gp206 [Erwinia phage Cronus]AWD90363.1 hypothetical protein [Erwinia phage Cronus]
MLTPDNVMVLFDISPSKSGIEMQLRMLKAHQHLKNGGQVLMFNYESEIDLEKYRKMFEV